MEPGFDKLETHLPQVTEIDTTHQFLSHLDALDSAITKYATETLKTPVTDELKTLIVKHVCKLSEEEIQTSPNKEQIEKIRKCCLECFISRRALNKETGNQHPNNDLRSVYEPHPLFETISHLGSNKVSLPCEVANITALSTDVPMIRATHSLNLVASTIGIIKTMKDGIHCFYEKVKILKLQRQIKTLENTAKSDSKVNQIKVQIEIENLHNELLARKSVIKKITKNAVPDALLNTTYFTGSVVGAALDPSMLSSGVILSTGAVTTGAIVSASLGGVAFGVGMLGISLRKIVKDLKKQSKFNTLRSKLLEKREQSSTLPTVQKIIDLKLSYMKNYQHNKLIVNHIKNSLNSAVGFFSVSSGLVSILIAAGVVVSAAAISATGIGLAVVIGLSASVCFGVAVHKYKLKRKALSLEKDLSNHQVLIIALENKIHETIKNGKTESLESLMDSYHSQKKMLTTAKANASLKYLLTGDGKEALYEILSNIDNLNENELSEVEKFFGIEHQEGLKYQPDMHVRKKNTKEALAIFVRAN